MIDQFYDTIEVKMPPTPGESYEFFRDIQGKSLSLTNFVMSRRLLNGVRMNVEKLELTIRHWSGDDMMDLCWLMGGLEVRVNGRGVVKTPLLKMQYHTKLETEIQLVDSDDIAACLRFGEFPFSRPTVEVWTDRLETDVEEIQWPAGLLSHLPKLRRAVTLSRIAHVARPRVGSCLVTLTMHGDVTRPEGA